MQLARVGAIKPKGCRVAWFETSNRGTSANHATKPQFPTSAADRTFAVQVICLPATRVHSYYRVLGLSAESQGASRFWDGFADVKINKAAIQVAR